MSPKETAKELVFKKFGCKKQYALIAVDEILGQFKWRPKDSLSYWEEVKLEILAL